MKDTNNTFSGVIIAIVLVTAVFLVLKLTGSSYAGVFLLIAGLALAAFLLLIILITVFAITSGKKDYEKRSNAVSVSSSEPEEIRAAKETILDINRFMRRIKNPAVKARAQETYDLCSKIITTVSRQPDETERSRQFFSYYLPTFATVLEKYLTLEEAGVDPELAEEKILGCLGSMNSALEKQYRNLFSNEILDLTVERNALETIIRKDGLE